MPAGHSEQERRWWGGKDHAEGKYQEGEARIGVRDTDSLCLRCGGTVRGIPWKEPCQGEKEGAEYPPCVERDGLGRYNKKGNRIIEKPKSYLKKKNNNSVNEKTDFIF